MPKLLFALVSVALIFGLCDAGYSQASKKRPIKKKPVATTKVLKTPTEPTPAVYPRPIKVAAGLQSEISEASQIVMPSDPEEGQKYPLVIFLPWTGGEASRNYALYASEFGRLSQFISMITPEPASTKDHTSQGFEAATYRYENRILKDIESLKQQGNVDMTKVVLVGFSMGGDMGWALVQRHPEIFRGAILSGTRTGWAETGRYAKLKSAGSKFFFVMGEDETRVRVDGLNATLTELRQNQISYRYERTPGDHVWTNEDQFVEAIEFLLN